MAAPLSYGQQALWTFEQMVPGSSVYHVPLAYRLIGPLRVELLERALTLVVCRHEALRTAFCDVAGEPAQVVTPPTEMDLPVREVSGRYLAEASSAVDAILRCEARTPFDLKAGRLLRALLIRLGEQDHVLSIVVHHIACDGWSLRLLTDEVSTTYRALHLGLDPQQALAPLPVQFTGYARWQRRWLTAQALERPLAYWTQALTGVSALELAGARPSSRRPSFDSGRLVTELDANVCTDLRGQAQAARLSVFSLLAACFTSALASHTGQADVVFGTMLAGRIEPELEHLIGYFVNLVALRAHVADDPTLRSLAARLGADMLAAIDNEVPFSIVVDRLAPRRRAVRHPVFQVAMQLLSGQSAPQPIDLPGLAVAPMDTYQGQQAFDLLVTFTEAGPALRLSVEYATQTFDEDWAASLTARLGQIIAAAAAGPDLRLSQLLVAPAQPERGCLAPTPGQEPAHGG